MNILKGLILITIAALIISMLPLKFKIRYSRRNNDDELIIKVFILTWLVIKVKFPFIKLERYLLHPPQLKVTSSTEGLGKMLFTEDKERFHFPHLERIPELYKMAKEKFKMYRPSFEYVLRKTKFKDLRWTTEFGVGDPFKTGILVGAVWTIKNIIISKVDQYTQISAKNTHLKVVPCFTQTAVSSYIYCIFDVRIGHIIITGLSLIVRTLFKGGKSYG